MRKPPFLVAALLAFTIAGAGTALAFDQQTLGGLNADGSPRFADPDEALMKDSINGITVTPGANFSKGAGVGVQSFDKPAGIGWQQLQPIGRLTR